MPIFKSDLIRMGFSCDTSEFSSRTIDQHFVFPPLEKVDTFKMDIPFTCKDHDNAEYIATAYIKEANGKYYFDFSDPVDGWSPMWKAEQVHPSECCDVVRRVEDIEPIMSAIKKTYNSRQSLRSVVRFLYVIKSEYGHKIGITHSPEKRGSLIGTHLPFKSEIVRLYPTKKENTREIEKWLHRYFREKRLNGEWFAIDASDIAKIDALILFSNSAYTPGDFGIESKDSISFETAIKKQELILRLKNSLVRSKEIYERPF